MRRCKGIRKGTIGYLAVFCLVLGLVIPPVATATTLDLRTEDSSGFINDAFFLQIDPQPTGTGYIDPFVRIQASGTEQGYNTDGSPFQFNEKDPGNYTHSLLLSDVAVVAKDGVDYRVFMLDINEPNGAKALLSLDALQVYLGSAGNFTHFDGANHTFTDAGAVSTLVYNLDKGVNSTVLLNYDLNSGSGSGDMMVYIPDALFDKDPAMPYLYLYSSFGGLGGDYKSGDGFEEWWAVKGTSQVPEPGMLLLLGSGLATLTLLRRK